MNGKINKLLEETLFEEIDKNNYIFIKLTDKLLDFYKINHEHCLSNYIINTTDPSGLSGCYKDFSNVLLIFDDRFKSFDISKTITERLKQIPKINKCISGPYLEFDISNYIFIIEKKQNKEYVIVYSNYPFDLGAANMPGYHKEIIKLLNDICNIEYYKYPFDKSLDKTDNKLIILNNSYIIKKYDESREKINDTIYYLSLKYYLDDRLMWFKHFNCILFKTKNIEDEFEKMLKEQDILKYIYNSDCFNKYCDYYTYYIEAYNKKYMNEISSKQQDNKTSEINSEQQENKTSEINSEQQDNKTSEINSLLEETFNNIDKYCDDKIYNFNDQLDKILNYYNITYEHNLYNYMINTTDPSGMSGCYKFFENVLLIFDDRFKSFDISKTITERLKQIPIINKCKSMGYIKFDISKYIFIIEKQQNKKYILEYSVDPFDLGGGNMQDYHKEIIKLLNDICNIEYYKYPFDKSLDKTDNKLIILNNNYICKKYNKRRIDLENILYSLSKEYLINDILWFKYYNCIFFETKDIKDKFEEHFNKDIELIKLEDFISKVKMPHFEDRYYKTEKDKLSKCKRIYLHENYNLITHSEDYYNFIECYYGNI